MAHKDDDNKLDKVMTLPFRVSFPAMFKAESYEGGEPKFGLVALFPKNTDLTPLKDLCERAASAKWGPPGPKRPALRSAFRDGSEKPNMDGYAGMIFSRITTKMRPGLVDRDRTPITEQDGKFYAGCWARATVCAYAYETKGNKGVALGLLNVQKLRDDKEFTGRIPAEDEFDAVDDSAFDAPPSDADTDF
jgi:hypothetical protein